MKTVPQAGPHSLEQITNKRKAGHEKSISYNFFVISAERRSREKPGSMNTVGTKFALTVVMDPGSPLRGVRDDSEL
jgi:hypothetical protein